MSNKCKLTLLLILFNIFILPQGALAVDADNWEVDIIYHFMVSVGPTEKSLLQIANNLLKYTFECKKRSIRSDKNNGVVINFVKQCNDVKQILINYHKSVTYDGYVYTVKYIYRNGAISLLDIYNRYNKTLMTIESDSNFNRTIKITLNKKYSDICELNDPLFDISTALKGNDFAVYEFVSKDKVFINTIEFRYYKRSS